MYPWSPVERCLTTRVPPAMFPRRLSRAGRAGREGRRKWGIAVAGSSPTHASPARGRRGLLQFVAARSIYLRGTARSGPPRAFSPLRSVARRTRIPASNYTGFFWERPMRLLATLFVFLLTCTLGWSAESAPFAPPWDDATAGPTNISGTLDKPAGKSGFVRVQEGHLFSGPQRCGSSAQTSPRPPISPTTRRPPRWPRGWPSSD